MTGGEAASATAFPRADARRWPRVLGAGAVSCALLALLALVMPWQEALQLWQKVSPFGLVAAATALAASYLAAGWRLATMLPGAEGARLVPCVAASLWHGLAMILLPVRLGELALIDGLRRYAGVPSGRALAVLLVQRIYDLLLVGLAFAVGVVALLAGHAPTLLSLAVVLVALLALARFLDGLLHLGAALVAGRGGAIGLRLHALLTEAGQAAASLATARTTIVLGTVVFWVADLLALWLIFAAFRVVLDPLTLLFLGAGLAIVHAVPLPTIGGLGLAETGLAGLLTLAGWQPAVALGLGVSVRLMLLVLHAVVIGILLPALGVRRIAAERAR